MTFLWKESFSVNVPDMDRQHQRFIALVSELSKIAEKQNIDDSSFQELFRELSSYAAKHFQEEESLLAKADFPELEQQKRHHQFFLAELERLDENFCRGDKTAVRGMVEFLRDWLFSHILMEDRKYATAFQKHSSTLSPCEVVSAA